MKQHNAMKMKLVFDNIIYSKEKQGGITNYWYEIGSRALQDKSYDCFFYEEVDPMSNYCRQRLTIPQSKLINHSYKSLMLARLTAIEVPFDDYFIYHSSYYRGIKAPNSYSEVTTVHDFTHNYYSAFHKKLLHNYLKYNTIKRSDGVICVSENTSNDLHKIFGPLKNKEFAIIHNGVSDDYYPIQNLNEDELQFFNSLNLKGDKYLLFVGGRTSYKNFNFVLELLAELKDYKLVVIGNDFNKHERKYITKDIQERIIVTHHITNNKLNVLYNNAHCLIYPSSYEGFGIPLIEAMRAGCPVIALNKSSVPEIAGNSAILIDDLNIGIFKQSVDKLNNLSVRSELIDMGLNQSKKYSWDKCAAETFEFYKHIQSKTGH
jgi:glycosyltransferase involved in cell wall biosynthesis